MTDNKAGFWNSIISGFFLLASIVLGYFLNRESKQNGTLEMQTKDLREENEKAIQKNNTLRQAYEQLKDECDKLGLGEKEDSEPIRGVEETMSGALPSMSVGDYKLDPLSGLEGNESEGTVTLRFNLTNNREDQKVYLYTKYSNLVGGDNLTHEAESAQISNSKVAKPMSYTSGVMIYKGQPLTGYIKFRAERSVSAAGVVSIRANSNDFIYRGKYQIHWK